MLRILTKFGRGRAQMRRRRRVRRKNHIINGTLPLAPMRVFRRPTSLHCSGFRRNRIHRLLQWSRCCDAAASLLQPTGSRVFCCSFSPKIRQRYYLISSDVSRHLVVAEMSPGSATVARQRKAVVSGRPPPFPVNCVSF